LVTFRRKEFPRLCRKPRANQSDNGNPSVKQLRSQTGEPNATVPVHNKNKIGEKKMTVKFTKDKETKTKVRYTATGEISGAIYLDKESDLAILDEILLQIN